MLADITRHSRFTAEEFRVLSTAEPIDIPKLHKSIHAMPSSALGLVFLENGKPVQPNPSSLDTCQRLSGSIGGIWPSSSPILSSMLDTYRKIDG